MAYRSLRPFDVEVKDGLWVSLRDVVPDDGDLIELGFDRLSKQSRFFRFMAAKKRLTGREVKQFAALNTADHAAVGALCMRQNRAHPVGIARYIRTNAEDHAAEIAITVVDAFQNRGIGTLLLGVLAKVAQAHGITEFLALVAKENDAMQHLLHELGGTDETPGDPEVNISMPIYQDPQNYPINKVGAYVREAYAFTELTPV
ncbi:GNAT family N-acetyltransferase [uncultured Roseobacter sp.]|uniref:GNAT family N-acetyltransferase n=1 Tax=uncultured Roseobacter sp. TaxID=114847 RepID=UPI002629FB78|nr:GNAT family N-acetyltransferase [uncultured Roseobacter sp.]